MIFLLYEFPSIWRGKGVLQPFGNFTMLVLHYLVVSAWFSMESIQSTKLHRQILMALKIKSSNV